MSPILVRRAPCLKPSLHVRILLRRMYAMLYVSRLSTTPTRNGAKQPTRRGGFV